MVNTFSTSNFCCSVETIIARYRDKFSNIALYTFLNGDESNASIFLMCEAQLLLGLT